ncbi:MAG: MFS transporter [Nostoc sp. CmiVER01]|uniref:MFS transporter n=1 Tax=Nostoc sp. CmiVER01 TaxID=3075384 RepID=UPI002AD4194F|nr:MFS transporter [Nostoc sp. CmiVER01]MDZ8126669.1 MFS transporter [Nostoc sp. CmiVER01]
MKNTQSLNKLGLLACLYISQYIPIMFLLQALPVFLRQQGVNLDAIGLLSLIALPLILKFLWSPLIDRYGFTRWGHYRFWIICFQLLVAALTVICAFFDIETNFTGLLICILLMCLFCSSQDIATDALAVGLLEPQERGLGNGIQTSGHYLGAIIGSGGMLILLNYWGWRTSLLILAGIVVLALIPVLRHQEQQIPDVKELQTSGIVKSYFRTLINPYRDRRTWSWLLILSLYLAGGNMANTMFRPLLVDIGLSLADIGWLMGVVSHGAGIIGAIAAGFLIAPLGRKRSLILFGLLYAIAMTAYFLPAFGITNLPILHLVAISVQITLGAAGTTLFTIIMDKSQLATAGTDFTVQTSFIYFGTIGASAISGLLAQIVSYKGVFAIGIGITLLDIILINQVFVSNEIQQRSPLVFK